MIQDCFRYNLWPTRHPFTIRLHFGIPFFLKPATGGLPRSHFKQPKCLKVWPYVGPSICEVALQKKRFQPKGPAQNQDICPRFCQDLVDLRKSSRPFAFLMMMQLGFSKIARRSVLFGFNPMLRGAFPQGVDQQAVYEWRRFMIFCMCT